MEKRFFTTLKRLLAILNQKIRQYTAFNTHQGSFEFKRMSFGLCNAGATFQRQMQQLLEEYIEFARNYIEDIIISSRNFEEHLVQIEICPFAYRTSKQKLQRKHHSRLLYGRYVRLPSDIDKWSTKDSFVDEIDKAWKLALKLIKKSAKYSERKIKGTFRSHYLPKRRLGSSWKTSDASRTQKKIQTRPLVWTRTNSTGKRYRKCAHQRDAGDMGSQKQDKARGDSTALGENQSTAN